jgi:hypothetical protein
MNRALVFANMCRVRKVVVLHVCTRRLSLKKASGREVECRVCRLCVYQNGICEIWGRLVLSLIISID